MPDDNDVVGSQDESSQEKDDLGSIQDFRGETIDDPTEVHQQTKEEDEKEEEGGKKKDEEELDETPTEDEEFDQQYQEVSKVWSRPAVKELVTKYPNLFKDFPDLRQVMFREAKFTEMYSTLEDAEEALLAKEDLDLVNQRLSNGDVSSMLEDIDKGDLPKLAGNFLPALFKKDSELYYKIINPIFDRTLKAAYQEGERTGNKNLKFGSMHLSLFIFGDESFAAGIKTIPQPEVKTDEKLESEREEFRQQKRTEAREAVVNSSLKKLEIEIRNGLPKEMSERLKQIVIDQIISEIDGTLNKDENHLTFMNRLWKQAEKSNYSGEHKARISSAYLARAKNLVPKLRTKLLEELTGEKTNENDNGRSQKRLGYQGSAPSTNHRQSVNSKNVVYEKSSDLEIIQGKATLKK